MKKKHLLSIVILVWQIAGAVFLSAQATQIDLNFNDGQAQLTPIHADENQPSYALSVESGILQINCSKRTEDWSFLGLFGIQLDISGQPTLQFRVKTNASTNFVVRVKSPMKSNPEEWAQIEKSISLSAGDFQYVFMDLAADVSADPEFDAANVKEIHVECTNGWENSFTGIVSVDYIQLGYPNQSKPSGGTGFKLDFNEPGLPPGLSYGTDYGASADGGALVIDIHKDGRWSPFTIVLDSLYNLDENRHLNLRIRSDNDLVLQLFLVDASGAGYQTEQVGSQYKYTELVAGKNLYKQARIFSGEDFIPVTYDFTEADDLVDFSRIEKIVLTANGTAMSYGGRIVIDEISGGSMADKMAYVGQLPDQSVYINAGEKSILVPEIMNASALEVNGGESLVTGLSVDEILYSQSTENDVPVTYGYSRIRYTAIPGATGTDTLHITALGKAGFADNPIQVKLTITGNQAPTIDAPDSLTVQVGKPYTINLTDISDGDPDAEQTISIAAVADSLSIVDTVYVDYDSDMRNGSISFTPLKPGNTLVSVKAADGEGAEKEELLKLAVFESINEEPSIDQVFKLDVVNNTGEQTLSLTGISDGDDASQLLEITAEVTPGGIITNPEVEYEPGNSTALFRFAPVQGVTGTAIITITVSDNGGTPENDGDKSVQMTFEIETLNPPVSGYVVDLSDPDLLTWLSPEANGIEYFVAVVDTLGSKALRIKMKDKWTYGGIWFQLPQELSLKQTPVVSYEVFSSDKQTWHWNYLYHAHGADGNLDRNTQNSSAHQFAANKGMWSNLVFDYRQPGDLNNGVGESIDPSRINAILFNMHDAIPSWPFTNATTTVYYRNIRFGDSCQVEPATPSCTIDPVATQTVFLNSGYNTIVLTGISNGLHATTGVTVTAASFDANIVPKPTLSVLGSDGTMTLTFTGLSLGYSDITVRVTAAGSNTNTVQFRIHVIEPDPVKDALVHIDLADEKQTIRGFGAFDVEPRFAQIYTEDLGASVIRLGIIGNQWEPVNDNDDPQVLNMDGFDYSAFDWDHLRNLKENGVKYFILTSWSPPAWMKRNLSLDHKEQAIGWNFTDNRMETYYYDEFAESMLALVKAFKEMAGIDLLALGLQNEPFFNEPYPSAILDAPHFIDLIKIVSEKLETNGFGHVGYYMPEQVFGIGSGDASCIGFLQKLRLDEVADGKSEFFAVHGYDQTGITPGFPNYSEWEEYAAAAAVEPNPKEVWMTETGFGNENWGSAMSLVGALHGSLWAGNISWWTTFGFSGDYLKDNEPANSFYAAKNFFRYVRPEAVRVATGTTNGDIMPTAFVNEDGSIAVVMINKSGSTITTRIQGNNLPDQFVRYRSSEKEKFVGGDTLLLSMGAIVLPANSVTTLVAYSNSLLTMNQVTDVDVEKNSGEALVDITGISNGSGTIDGLVLSEMHTNESLFSSFSLSEIQANGSAAIAFTPATDASGFSQVTLSLTDGETERKISFYITVGYPTRLDEKNAQQVMVYPNPASDRVYVELPAGSVYSRLKMYDNMGRLVVNQIVEEDGIEIETGNLGNGIYLIELEGISGRSLHKISVK